MAQSAVSNSIIFPLVNPASKMKVLGKKIYRGPHFYSHTPMIRIELNLGALEYWPTNKIPGFKEALLDLLPGLKQHGCSYGAPGGFVRRIEEGTWMGHVIEHVAIELQTIAGTPVTRGKTRSARNRPGVYNVMFEYEIESLGLAAGRYAIEIVNSLVSEELRGVEDADILAYQDEFINISDAITQLKKIKNRDGLGPTTQSIVDAARDQGIPVMRLNEGSMLQLGWGKYQRIICGSMTDKTSQIAVDNVADKELTKKLLRTANISVPEGDVVQTAEGAVEVAKEIGFPVAIKPLNGNHGRGVTTNIMNEEQAQAAFNLAKEHGPYVIVEQSYTGCDYRVLVIDGRVVAVAERVPAHVTGNGVDTITALIEKVNADPKRGEGHENVLSKIVVDEHVTTLLEKNGLTLETVPSADQVVWLRCTANLSTGGTAIDRTDDICPSNITLMERAARTVGLDIAGIDVVAKDISVPLSPQNGGIVEVNASPGFRMHLAPAEGRSRPAGASVVSMLFPKGMPSRIPTVAITGTNGKSTTARMVQRILRHNGKCVGLSSTSGVYINDEMVWKGDASGPTSARMLLRDRSIDYAVLETARGGILREGLAIDACDVGAVLNVTADHLGLGGIDTLEDLAAVKSVVVESVASTGISVLNADDPLTRGMAKYAGGSVCFFSMHGGHEMKEYLREHVDQGGCAIVREKWIGHEEIVIHQNGQRMPLMKVDQIPATFKGMAEFNIQNAMAAAAICLSLGIDVEIIRSGLASFSASYEENPGRFNIHDGHGFRVIMDYAHNPASLKAFLAAVDNMRGNYRNVIGMVSVPGDRRDDDIREMGQIGAGTFDVMVFREGEDRRGRPPGELLALLTQGACKAGFAKESIVSVETEEEAVDACLKMARPDDLVVLSPADIDGTWKRMMEFKPQAEGVYISEIKTPVFHA